MTDDPLPPNFGPVVRFVGLVAVVLVIVGIVLVLVGLAVT